MKLEHSFTVPADLDTVWQAVLDPERVAPCMPGATLTEVDGDAFKGSVKVKLGPISLLYKGSGEFLSKDEDTRTVVIKASGKDARGNGTAAATVTVTLTGEGDSTAGTVVTDLSITGKPAQFGRGMISEVGGKILDTFATCLATKLAPEEESPAPALSVVKEDKPVETAAAPVGSVAAARAEAAETGRHAANEMTRTDRKLSAAPTPAEPETEAIDLLAYAGPSVVKRAVPLLAVVAAVLAFITLRRRNR
ncbi:SRPBCC family protein [Actinophytocola oryzae]|uniref:Carbon monoxide dehydrogenase subunit G n=1 Tax=Actinophytocola oryzae TaxID=502181 RepID=A0A4R7V331_9PSEU|nr:SRPBCC family protein [Actinophytocola oryzae]TDV41866.1 carbon monoxide dehydrogenase subunit G [Actinophytocola oryzae]